MKNKAPQMITPEVIVEEFIHEYYIVEAIAEGEVLDTFFYLTNDTRSEVVRWFYENIIMLPEDCYVNTMEHTERNVMQISLLKDGAKTIYPDPITEIAYYKPLYNLSNFLEYTSKETQSLFTNRALYTKIDDTNEVFEFLMEQFYEEFFKASKEVQRAFAEDVVCAMNLVEKGTYSLVPIEQIHLSNSEAQHG